VPLEFLRPESVMQALVKYLDFTDEAFGNLGTGDRQQDPGNANVPPREIKKGMTVADVEDLYGQPINRRERMEGTLRVVTCVYSGRNDALIEAEFVEGVLIRYRISSK